jgi:anionic cell wall polymer biosynthesis LytR-Cps2A-Psr (LCP) family protein
LAYTVETNFAGFVGMVDDLGGIDVDVPVRMRDSASGARFDPGLQHMDGAQALAFSRNRHISGGDFQRTADQALVILAALAKVQDTRPDISETLRLVGVFMKHGELHNAGAGDLVHLSRLALGLRSAAIRNEVVPSETGRLGTGSVVYSLPEAQDLFADLRDNAILDTYKTLASIGSPQDGD